MSFAQWVHRTVEKSVGRPLTPEEAAPIYRKSETAKRLTKLSNDLNSSGRRMQKMGVVGTLLIWVPMLLLFLFLLL